MTTAVQQLSLSNPRYSKCRECFGINELKTQKSNTNEMRCDTPYCLKIAFIRWALIFTYDRLIVCLV